jgi:hypothetical protein
MALIEVEVPDIGDFDAEAVIERLVNTSIDQSNRLPMRPSHA